MKCGLFLISSMVLGRRDQLQIIWQLYLLQLRVRLIDSFSLSFIHSFIHLIIHSFNVG